jgi:hypothetical protein
MVCPKQHLTPYDKGQNQRLGVATHAPTTSKPEVHSTAFPAAVQAPHINCYYTFETKNYSSYSQKYCSDNHDRIIVIIAHFRTIAVIFCVVSWYFAIDFWVG